MSEFFKNKNNLLTALFVVVIVFAIGFQSGKSYNFSNAKNNLANTENSQVDFEAFWKAWDTINEKYVPTNSTTTEVKVSDQDRVYGAIEGMVRSLGDPYTVFFPPAETKSFNEEISGQIEGIGVEIGVKNNALTVIAPVKGTPAYKAGIKAGDVILSVDGVATASLSSDEAIKHIRGKRGTSVKLTIARAGVKDPFDVSIVRDYINMPTVDTEVRGDVFIIRLYSFSAISPNLFRDALRQFIDSGRSKLILDLRGNPGGYLEAAMDMASWFLPAGKVVVKEDFRNEQDAQVFRSKGYNIFNENLKMVVLIDNGSASASEILAGALKEHGVATLVGTQSFGKGSVQELVDITPDTSLKVTIARWLTPNGNSISHNGIKPDVEVKLDEKKFLEQHVDTQLNKAIEILSK